MSKSGKRGGDKEVSGLQLYLHGLGISVRDNAQAFGFSILITVSYGIVSGAAGKPSSLELVGFALSAVAGVSLLNVLVTLLKAEGPDDSERSYVMLVGTATDFLSVGAGLGVVFAVSRLGGWLPWILAPLLAGVTYCLVQGMQIALAKFGSDEEEKK